MPLPDGQSCWAPIPNQMILAQLIRFDWTPIHRPSSNNVQQQQHTALNCPSCNLQASPKLIRSLSLLIWERVTIQLLMLPLREPSLFVLAGWSRCGIRFWFLTLAPCERVGTRNHHDRLHIGRRVKQRPGNDSLSWPEPQIVGPPRQQAMTLATSRGAGEGEDCFSIMTFNLISFNIILQILCFSSKVEREYHHHQSIRSLWPI